MTGLTRFSVLLALAATLGCAKAGSGQMRGFGPKDRAIFVHLYMQSGKCTPMAGQEPVAMGRGDRVVWEIKNSCDENKRVVFQNFKRSNGNSANPTASSDLHRMVPANDQAVTLPVRIRANAELDTYKYDILVDDNDKQVLDPELEVEY